MPLNYASQKPRSSWQACPMPSLGRAVSKTHLNLTANLAHSKGY